MLHKRCGADCHATQGTQENQQAKKKKKNNTQKLSIEIREQFKMTKFEWPKHI